MQRAVSGHVAALCLGASSWLLLIVLLPALAGCGGDRIYLPRPCTGSPLLRDDVVVFGLPPDEEMPAAAHGRPVECHFRPVGGDAFTTLPMDLVLPGVGRPLFAAHLPGVTEGRVEYFFTFTNSNLDHTRLPREGVLTCPGR